MNEMNIERLKIADLKPAEKNTRTHGQKQIAELIRSFKKFGQIRPIVIDENNVIWCGNGFYMAAKESGETEVYCLRRVGLTEDDKKKLMLADNQIYTLGGTNTIVMDEFLSTLGDFDVPGFDPETLQHLYGEAEKAAEEMLEYGSFDSGAVKEIAEVETRREAATEQRVFAPSEPKPTSSVPPDPEDDSLPPTIRETSGAVNIPKDESTRPFIICPRCGEKIWL